MRETDYDDTQLYEVLWNLKGQVFALQAIIGMVLRRVAENGNTKDAIIAEIRMVMHDVRTARTDDTPFPPSADLTPKLVSVPRGVRPLSQQILWVFCLSGSCGA